MHKIFIFVERLNSLVIDFLLAARFLILLSFSMIEVITRQFHKCCRDFYFALIENVFSTLRFVV